VRINNSQVGEVVSVSHEDAHTMVINELLEALIAYVNDDDVGERLGSEKYRDARTAIAKATREQK
jgi:hypothetical protein